MVACKEVSLAGAVYVVWCVCRVGATDQGPPTLPEHIENVSCDGTERSLANCRFSNVTDSVVTHLRDVYIVCLPGPLTYSGVYERPCI